MITTAHAGWRRLFACKRPIFGFCRHLLLATSAMYANTSNAAAADITPPTVYTMTPTGVNVSDRGFTFTNTDLSIGTLKLERFWLGGPLKDPNTMPFGKHMGHNFDIYVKERSFYSKGPPRSTFYRAVVHIGNTSSGTYDIALNVNPRYISPNEDDAYSGILAFVNGAYVYTDHDGTIYTFDPNVPANGASGVTQRVSTIAYASGRTLTFSYDGSHNLTLVSSNDGYAIAFEYTADAISRACAYDTAHTFVSAGIGCSGAPLKTDYSYSSGVLTKFINPLNQTTQYDYVGQQVSCITPPGYADCKVRNEYDVEPTSSFYQIKKQTLADGSVWTFGGGSPNTRDPDYQPEDGDAAVYIQDPLHQGTSQFMGFTFSKSSPHSYTDMNGNMTQYSYSGGSSYDYHPNGDYTEYGSMLKKVILPENNEYDAVYDPTHFNLISSRTWKAKANSGLSDISQTFSYPDCDTNGVTVQQCVHPNAVVDANGNQTDWRYTSYGMPEWEMQPAPSAGKARPLTLYSYLSKNAFILDGDGNLTPSGTPIWLPNTETRCQTAAGNTDAICDTSKPIMTTTYEYGQDGTADNLLLRGKVVAADGKSLRTCYRYDAQGNVIAETTPRAGLTSCPA